MVSAQLRFRFSFWFQGLCCRAIPPRVFGLRVGPAQTFTDWECLCIDDGSTDESGAILDEYAQKDSRFRGFHKKNGGVSAARNLALDNAKGNWIWFVDSDDAIAPHALNALQEKLNRYPEAKAITLEIVGE